MDIPGMGVEVQIGSAFIPSGDNYPYVVFMDASENVTLATADGSNPRIDLIVAYVDLTVVDDTNPNNPGALVLENITGTPSGSPAIPNNAAVLAVIGASNPYIILAQVAVATAASTITNANITDRRTFARVGASNLGGSSWAMQSFTPSWTNLTPGSGTNTGYYIQTGKMVTIHVSFTMGAGSSMGTSPTLTLPVTASSNGLSASVTPIGQVGILDSGNAQWTGSVIYGSTTTAVMTVSRINATISGFDYLVPASITSSIPMAWGTGDILTAQFTYQAA